MAEEPIIQDAPQDQIGLFIDGRHLYEAAVATKIKIDYKKLLGLYQAEGKVVCAYYYNAVLPEPDTPTGWPLFDWLDCNGYITRIKQARTFIDHKGIRQVKNGLTADIVHDMLVMAPDLTHIVLYSGQSDLCQVVDTVRRKRVRVTVVSTESMIAVALRLRADRYIDLIELAPLITRIIPDGMV